MNVHIISIIICQFIHLTHSARIFALFPDPEPGLNIIYQKLVQVLADRGHSVTLVSSYQYSHNLVNGSVRDYVLQGFAEDFDVYKSINPSDHSKHLQGLALANKTLFNPTMKNFMANKHLFDLFITDLHYTDSLLAFGPIFNCPCIVFSSRYYKFLYYPQRLQDLYLKYLVYQGHNSLLQNFHPGLTSHDLYSNVVLNLVNTYHGLQRPHLASPNMKYVGGFHVPPPEKLPQELKAFLDRSFEGAVYVNVALDPSLQTTLKKVLKSLKVKVIWRQNKDKVLKNTFIKPWFPQSDVLAHPKLSLFITNGGFGSLLEATYHGVPTLIIANHDQQSPCGVTLSHHQISQDSLYATIKDLLQSNHSDHIKLYSQLLRNGPMKPQEKLVFWVEHVLGNNGYSRGGWLESGDLYLVGFTEVVIVLGILVGVILMWLCLCSRNIVGNKVKSE